ncbi:hypothetical protein ACFFU2_00080 [Halomonas alkalicola]|uniref:hypothetical protein n=1 Tax=Halomonas alkalicola TaxID=1930622 RepID=UPI0035E54920
MSDKDRRLGVSEINLVTRHLKLVPCDEAAIQAAIADIDQLYGLESVSYDSRKSRLDLAYDATRICLDCVEDILRKHAVEEASRDWEVVKRGWGERYLMHLAVDPDNPQRLVAADDLNQLLISENGGRDWSRLE